MIQLAKLGKNLIDYEHFRTLVGDGEKADLIDGVIYVASPDTRLNNTLNGFLYSLIDGFTAARNIEGFTFVSRFSCKLTEFRSPEPDVGYVRPERMNIVQERHLDGAPDIAVEIVSRDSRQRDYGAKLQLYQDAGVSEYWIVDPPKRRVQFLGIVDGRYEPLPLDGNRIFRCVVIPGFWLDVNWLFASPLPRAYHCLEKILAEKPKKTRKRS